MPRACLTSARFSMLCDILKPAGAPESDPAYDQNPSDNWEYYQDPDSGAINKRWVDDPNTVVNEGRARAIIPNVPLMARGVLTSGIQGAGSTERFDEIYHNVDWVKAVFGKNTNITKRDQITNIRTKRNGELVWKEEEISGYPATTFDVMGVTPVFDPFSNLVEYSVLLQRSEVQGG